MTALLDTGFLLAVISPNDPRHRDCVIELEREPDPLLPSIILTELAYMVTRDVSREAFVQFMRSVFAGELKLIFPTTTDLERAIDLFEQYRDSRIDFVDCAITAMSERLNIVRLLTVDQRDFRILRPTTWGGSAGTPTHSLGRSAAADPAPGGSLAKGQKTNLTEYKSCKSCESCLFPIMSN